MPSRVKHLIRYILRLWELIKKNKYKAIHVHGSSTMMGIELIIAKILGVPVRIAHSRNTYTKHPAIDRFFRPIFNLSYTNALACGKEAEAFLFKNKGFDVFYNGKDFEKFRYNEVERTAIRMQYGLTGKIVLGFVGTLHEQKNPLFLIEVFSNVLKNNSNTVLMVIGSGKLEEEMKMKTSELGCGSSVIFIGKSNEVNRLIQGCDLMLLPSLYEGLPNVVLEWQIAGIPSLVSDQVTKECRKTELVSFLPIDKGPDIWSNTICQYGENTNASEQSNIACDLMAKAGFEINKSCDRIRNLYLRGELPNE